MKQVLQKMLALLLTVVLALSVVSGALAENI